MRKYRHASIDEQVFRELLLSGLTIGPTPEAVLQRVADRAAKLLNAPAVYVERLDPERRELVATALHGEGLPSVGTRGPYEGSLAEQAIDSGRAIIVGNVKAQSRSILASLAWAMPAMVLPIQADHNPLGALIVIRRVPRLTKRDIESLQVFADLLAVSLRRAILLEKLDRHGQELEEAVRRRDELLRVLAHDLRNPINTIAMAASILANNPPSETGCRKLYEIIDRSAKRMNRLIQDLLDEAVIERSGSLPINVQLHPASSLAEEICELSRVQARTKTVHIECEIEGKAVVYADRDRILQVLTNLIDNALKFTPAGGRITVRSEVHNDHVRFSISDTGPGIPEEYREKIFEPYFQAPETAHLGSGLGLAISKQIIEQHGGSIWVESSEGAGATFTFTLPANPVLS